MERYRMQAAEKTVFLADSSKFGKKAFSTVCDWDSIDVFVTDHIDDSFKAFLEQKGIEVILAD